MSGIAKGSFIVTMQPQSEPDAMDGVTLGRMSLDKVFGGEFRISIVDGKHLYEFEYSLPDTQDSPT